MMKRLCLGLLVPLVALAQDYRPQPTDAEKARMASAVPSSAQVKVSRPRQVLVYCDHKGFYHGSEPEDLKKYDVICLNGSASRSPW